MISIYEKAVIYIQPVEAGDRLVVRFSCTPGEIGYITGQLALRGVPFTFDVERDFEGGQTAGEIVSYEITVLPNSASFAVDDLIVYRPDGPILTISEPPLDAILAKGDRS